MVECDPRNYGLEFSSDPDLGLLDPVHGPHQEIFNDSLFTITISIDSQE